MGPKEKVSQVFDEIRQLTYENNAEHALVKTTAGKSQILRGGELGIDLGDDVAEVLAHTHPYTVNATGPSADDIAMLVQLNQRSSILLEHSQTIVFGRQGTIAWR